MSELDQLTEVCVRLGAERAQARIMAAQLLKRAGQLALERGIYRETALANLLQLVVQARSGEVTPAPNSRSRPTSDEK